MSKKTVQFSFDEAGLVRSMIGAAPTQNMNIEFAQRLGRVWEALGLTEEESEQQPEHIERAFTSGDRKALITVLTPPMGRWTIQGWRNVAVPILVRLGWKEPPIQDMEDGEDD